MAILLIRTVILYFFTLLAIKAMGKREIGQLQPFEFVVMLIISEMASFAMQSNTTTLASSVIPISVIAVLQIGLSLLNLKSEKARAILCGSPTIVISGGKLQQENLAKLRLNLNDIEELARSQGYFDISAIENAIMETSGQLSIMPRADKRPLETGDILEAPPKEQMGALLILDGHINQAALRRCGRNEQWLIKQLREARIDSAADVFAAGLDESGSFFWQKKDPGRKRK